MRIHRRTGFAATGTGLLISIWLLLPIEPARHSAPAPTLDSPLVTLTSTSSRLLSTLPITLLSLVAQSLPASSIHVFLPLDAAARYNALNTSLSLPSIFSHPLVAIHFVEDRGPATKLLPALEQLLESARHGDATALEKRVVVVDDDHAYSPRLILTLVEGYERLRRERAGCAEGCAVGFRGWRLRTSLHWGVLPGSMWRHVIEGGKIQREYRVAVLTANEGYLILPKFFLSAPTSSVSSSFTLTNYTNAPPSAHLVDDAWVSAHLSTSLTPRFVLPMPPLFPSIDLTTNDHPLERHMARDGVLRDKGNTAVLRWARSRWEREERSVPVGESIWWDWNPAGREPAWTGVGAGVQRAWGRWMRQRWVGVLS